MLWFRKVPSLGLTRFVAMGGFPASGEGVGPFFAYPKPVDAHELDASAGAEDEVSGRRSPRVLRDLGADSPRRDLPTNEHDMGDKVNEHDMGDKVTVRRSRRSRSLEPV